MASSLAEKERRSAVAAAVRKVSRIVAATEFRKIGKRIAGATLTRSVAPCRRDAAVRRRSSDSVPEP